MDESNSEGLLTSPRVAALASGLLAVAIAFIAIQVLASLHNLDASPNGIQNTVTVSGEGKVSAAPDLATLSFTVSADGDTASAAQDAAAKKINTALAALKAQKIADKDIQTSSYNVYPRYSYTEPCPAYAPSAGALPPCVYNGGTPKQIGFTASQDVTVKVHDTNATGAILSALGGAGISNISGPNFTVENPEALQSQARAKAIADARSKANTLAKELGVRIVRVTNYSEGGGTNYPLPLMKAESGAAAADARPTPAVPSGENEITVDVSVTYEIR